YREAQRQIEGASGSHQDMLSALARWAALRTRARRARGGLDFELPGVEIGFDADRRPREVRLAQRLAAHRLVEEAMLAAN
ncbi:RNB domain-containing ribonuclease, partial [Enterococcus casseliflavus]|uniref:RNB domain-containing ribonuclease n=1 Tax=Enterococcus casseliflavus TaxID=37734 RepID=UPI003D098212